MKKTRKLVIAAVLATVITIMTAYVCHVPVGTNGGYVHFGDTFIYIAACMLPFPYAAAAAAIGAGLADLLTAPVWILPTVIIKTLICVPFTSKKSTLLCPRNVVAVFVSAVISISGYAIAEGIMFGNWAASLLSLSGGIVQSGVSGILFIIAASLLDKKDIKNTLKI